MKLSSFSLQHIFIPVLPESLVDYISAPMPYLIGVQTDLFESKVGLMIGWLNVWSFVQINMGRITKVVSDH